MVILELIKKYVYLLPKNCCREANPDSKSTMHMYENSYFSKSKLWGEKTPMLLKYYVLSTTAAKILICL